MYGKGISREGDIIDVAVECDIINKSGAWYSYNDQRLGQGRENAKQFFVDNPHILEEIEYKIREKFDLIKHLDSKPRKNKEDVQ